MLKVITNELGIMGQVLKRQIIQSDSFSLNHINDINLNLDIIVDSLKYDNLSEDIGI